MSHLTVIKTEIRDLNALEQALLDLGLETEHDAIIVTWSGEMSKVPLACLKLSGKPLIGFVKQADGTYGAIADWWYVRHKFGLTQDDFVKKVSQRYAYCKVKKALEEQGFRVLNESVDDQKSICLQVMKWR